MLTFAVGKEIAKTIDAVTACGNINLINADLAQLQADYATLHTLQEQGLFTAKPTPDTPAEAVGAVTLTDGASPASEPVQAD
eukprot:3733846-Prymnesium_polylepis.1